MTLQSPVKATLTKVESPAASSVEIHSMTMKDGVMKMRLLDTLALAAGKPAKLEAGGFHLMLLDLKKPLKSGENVPFILHFKDSMGKASTINITAPVKSSAN